MMKKSGALETPLIFTQLLLHRRFWSVIVNEFSCMAYLWVFGFRCRSTFTSSRSPDPQVRGPVDRRTIPTIIRPVQGTLPADEDKVDRCYFLGARRFFNKLLGQKRLGSHAAFNLQDSFALLQNQNQSH